MHFTLLRESKVLRRLTSTTAKIKNTHKKLEILRCVK